MVAVISSGIDTNAGDPTHVSSTAKYLDMTDAYSSVDGSSLPSDLADADPTKEGTRILTEVLQGINDAVAAGGSSNVEVVPIRDYMSTKAGVPIFALAGAIDHAADIGAKVIDVNYEAPASGLSSSQTLEIQQALAYAQSEGAMVVVPAGDGFGSSTAGVNLDQAGANRANVPAQFHTSNMLVVTATDALGNLGSLSDWGATHVDIGAPTTLANRVTGMAAGYAAGVAAVVAATRTDWNGSQLADHIKATAQPIASLAGKVTSGGMIHPSTVLAGIANAPTLETPGDYNGDALSDFAVYGDVPGSAGYGFAMVSSTQGYSTANPVVINNNGNSVGVSGTIPVSGNFLGQGVTEPAVLAPAYNSSGQLDGKYNFAILTPNAQGQYYVSTFIQQIGQAGDIPVVGDFSGDGKDDLALYGDHNGVYDFEIFTAASGFNPADMETITNNGVGFGGPGYVPVVGNFFGDGKTALGVYGPDYVNSSYQTDGKDDFAALDMGSFNSAGQITRTLYVKGVGQAGDIAIAGDYDGDGKDDLALYGDHNGQYNFQVLSSSSGFNPNDLITLDNGVGFGGPGFVPISGNYFGDSGPDISVYGPEYNANGQPNGLYDFSSIDLKTKKSITIKNFGGPTTIPAATSPYIKWYEAETEG
jgi:hypothetical protein